MAYFLELAQTLNFSNAAQKLGISQPTLTQALKKAESDLGVELFERDGRELRLSPYGRVFLKTCGYITEMYGDTLQKLNDMKHGCTGSIRVGIAPSRAPYTVPPVLSAFREVYPGVRVEISEMLTADIRNNVENGIIDIGVLVMQEPAEGRITCLPLENEQIAVACKPSLLPEGAGTPEDNGIFRAELSMFANVPFVLLGDEQLIVSQFRALCAGAHVNLNCVARCKNIETSLALAEAGIGATLVTNTGMDYYRSAFPGLQYYNIAEKTLGRNVYLIYRKNQFIDPPMQYLIELLSKKGA